MARIAGQRNWEKENMCKADVKKGSGGEITMQLPPSKSKEINRSSIEKDNGSSISSEFNFEIDLHGKRYRSTICPLNLMKLYRRSPELANLLVENSSEIIVKDSEISSSVKLLMDFDFQGILRPHRTL
ncbi:uncharacterized protein TNCV_3006861 [Trichonephila clavipes]|nr:uncharacterized protein TNCV_3006861 [Trichonephila clavipes]